MRFAQHYHCEQLRLSFHLVYLLVSVILKI